MVLAWPLGCRLIYRSGLTRDDVRLHDERIKLWHDFNHCWLAVLQKQKDLTQEMLDTGHPPPAPQSMLREDFLERMGREITRHCDSLEKSGLVDYQMGVWEEEIINGKLALAVNLSLFWQSL